MMPARSTRAWKNLSWSEAGWDDQLGVLMLFLALLFTSSVFAADPSQVSPVDLADAANTYMHTALKAMRVFVSGTAGSSYSELDNLYCRPDQGGKIYCTAEAQMAHNQKRTVEIPDTRNFLMNLRRLIQLQKLHIASSSRSFRLATIVCQTSDDEGKSTDCRLSQQAASPAKPMPKAAPAPVGPPLEIEPGAVRAQ